MGAADLPGSLITATAEGLSALDEGQLVAVACSGGPDSVALLHLVRAARPDLQLQVLHVRHGLREDQADADAAAANARLLDVGFSELRVDAGGDGEGPEDQARRARFGALVTAARAAGADAIALGHTGDDQAETVLLRLARGTGPDGLAAMRPDIALRGIRLLRPLLSLRRDEVRACVGALPHVEDPTNRDEAQRRQRARSEVLPALGRLRGGDEDAVPALMRLAEIVAEERSLLDAIAVRDSPVRFGMAVIAPHPSMVGKRLGLRPGGRPAAALAARVLRRAWRMVPAREDLPPSSDALARLMRLEDGTKVSLPGGVDAARTGDELVLLSRKLPRLPRVDLPVGEAVRIPGFAMSYELTTLAHPSPPSGTADFAPSVSSGVPPRFRPLGLLRPPWDAGLAVAEGIPLHVRGRGAGGDRQSRDALAAFPAVLRDHVPLVCDDDGNVLMVGARRTQPGDSGPATLWLRAQRL